MFWAIAVLLGIAALVVIVAATFAGSLLSGVVNLLFAPHRETTSPTGTFILAGCGIAATLSGVGLNAIAPGSWIVPILIWLIALGAVRNSAPLKETDQQRHAREAREPKQAHEDEKRAAARRAIAERREIDSFTKDGLVLLKRARAAINDVNSTEAARDGWLGDQNDLDFSVDLKLISDHLLQARRIEKIAERTKKLPNPTPDDNAMLRDAQKTITSLRGQAKARGVIIADCAKQAKEIDRLLQEERRQKWLDKQRDEARRQLAAELYYAEATPRQRESDTADLIAARVAAFKELKHVVDAPLRREIQGGAEASDWAQSAFNWVRGQLPF